MFVGLAGLISARHSREARVKRLFGTFLSGIERRICNDKRDCIDESVTFSTLKSTQDRRKPGELAQNLGRVRAEVSWGGRESIA